MAFVGCQSEHLVLREGPVTWIPWPRGLPRFGAPRATFRPAPAGAIDIRVQWGLVSILLRAFVVDGELVIDLSNSRTLGLDGPIQQWVHTLNGHLAANGRGIAHAELAEGSIVITKE